MIPFEENELNITSLIIAGFVDLQKYRFFYFFLMLSIYIFIVSFNSTIVYVICTQRSLHEPMYIFIAALLLNAVMVITAIYPKLLFDVLSDRRMISFKGCLIQSFIVYSFASSEFFLLSVMAYDRYVSICRSMHYHTLLPMKTVKKILVFAWLWPASQVAVMNILIFIRVLRDKVCEVHLEMIFCDLASINKVICGWATISYAYGMYIMVSVVFCPLFFIVFTYARILIVCLQKSKDFRKKAIQTCGPHLQVLFSFAILAIFDVLKDAIFSDHTVRFIMAMLVIIYPYLFNPIIYGLKMKEISKHLRKLFSQLTSKVTTM